MYTPHTVTIFNAIEDSTTHQISYNLTVLNGVFLDISKADNVMTSGIENADSATLFIPFSVDARSTLGAKKTYLAPHEFASASDKSQYWTLDTGGDTSASASFFAKGVVSSASSYRELRKNRDDVFNITSVDIRDFGSRHMQHWQVSGR